MDTHVRRISTIEADDRWHYVGNTGEPAFQNSWVNYGAVYAPCRFRRDSEGYVHIQFFVKSGAGNIVFNIPAGYRPSGHVESAAVKSGEAGCRVEVHSNGNVLLVGYHATFTGFFGMYKAEV